MYDLVAFGEAMIRLSPPDYKRLEQATTLDLNYRAKLWSPEDANKTLVPMMDIVDILITTKGDTLTILGIEAENDQTLAKLLLDKYPIEMVAVSYREGDTAWQCRFSAIAATRAKTYTTRTYNTTEKERIVEK